MPSAVRLRISGSSVPGSGARRVANRGSLSTVRTSAAPVTYQAGVPSIAQPRHTDD